MSKISVFKYNIVNNEQTINTINNVIGNYLQTSGFTYNNEYKCYMTGNPNQNNTAGDIAATAAASVAASVVTGGAVAIGIQTVHHCFEYYVNGNELIIKAYILSKGIKSYIHSTFNNSQAGAIYYGSIKKLNKVLEGYNIKMTSKEIEKIDDGSTKKILLRLLLVFGIMIVVIIILVLICNVVLK